MLRFSSKFFIGDEVDFERMNRLLSLRHRFTSFRGRKDPLSVFMMFRDLQSCFLSSLGSLKDSTQNL
jgi:hypothetical protein